MSGRYNRLAQSPTMVGAITVLIAIVAVFLAYNANSGLPFVASYRISAQVPNAGTLVPGNEVRVGGVRVGIVEAIEPVQHPNGAVNAKVDLKLDRQVEPLPTDSTVIVRARSALGLKYVELVRGTQSSGYPEGSVLPLRAARPEPVEIDEVIGTFDETTRAAIQQNLLEFGNALAGRGPSLNRTVGVLPELLRRLQPVMRDLGLPSTRLERFVRALSAAAAEVAPVAEAQARLFVALDTTFGALAAVARPGIQETISQTPPTLDQGLRSLPRIRPFLAHSEALFADLRPGVAALRAAAPRLASAFESGARVLPDAPELNAELPPTAESLQAFGNDPDVQAGLDRLTQTATISTPLLRFVAPAQTVCNYASLLFRNASSLLSRGDGLGTWQRFTVHDPPDGPNNEGSPSSAPAGGGADNRNFLHVNPYPHTASPGQPQECEAGNEPYIAGERVIGNVPGNQGTATDGQETEGGG